MDSNFELEDNNEEEEEDEAMSPDFNDYKEVNRGLLMQHPNTHQDNLIQQQQ